MGFGTVVNKNRKLPSVNQRWLTRREVLEQLRRLGVGRFSELKKNCREFEEYMLSNYELGTPNIKGVPMVEN